MLNPFRRSEPTCLHLWNEVKNGYQYCSKCGLARIAGCSHHWIVEKSNKIVRTDTSDSIGEEIIYKCTKCTQRKYVRTYLNCDPVVKML